MFWFLLSLQKYYEIYKYHTQAIITHGLYILNPLFEVQKRFFKEFFSENSAFVYG